MAFTDPVVVDLPIGTTSLPRVGVGEFKSNYLDETGNVSFSASSLYGKRTRSTIRLDFKTLVANPELPTTNNPISMSVYLVVDRNAVGFSLDNLQNIVQGFLDTISADGYAQVSQVLQGQS